MGKLFEKYKWLTLCAGIILLIASVLVITISIVNVESLSKALSIIVAVFLFIFGGIMILSSLIEERSVFFSSPLAYGAVLIAVGVVLCILPMLLESFIVYFIAVFAIAFGVIEIVKGIALIVNRVKPIWFILCFIIAAVALGFGITALVIDMADVLKIVYIFVGVILGAFGLVETIYGIKLMKM